VLVYAVPFLDPDAVRSSLGALNGVDLPRSHEAVLTAAMDIVRADLAGRAPGVRSVVVSHAFVVGASAPAAISDSERDIRVGGSDAVSAGIFAGIDYVALGHLHGAQEPVGPEGTRLRYSGSPLRYSFSEADHTKSFTILDLPAVGPVSVDLVEVQQPRGMARLSGPLAELLESSAHDGVEEHWLQVTVTDDARPPELVSRIRARFPHALVVRHEPTGGPLVGSGLPATAVAGAAHDPVDVARAFVQHVTGGDPTEPEVTAFRAAYERALAEGRSV
jgi:exonuclease SbcD